MTVPCERRMNPQTVVAYSLGILLFFYSGKAPTRLFVVLSVTVKPFDDVVAGYTPAATAIIKDMTNSMQTPPPVAGCRLDNTRIITYPLTCFYPIPKRFCGWDCG